MDEKRKAGEGEGAACGIVENGEGGDCRNCRPGTGPWDFMTERETTVLKAMRALRGRATEVKNRIRRLKRGHPKARTVRKTKGLIPQLNWMLSGSRRSQRNFCNSARSFRT